MRLMMQIPVLILVVAGVGWAVCMGIQADPAQKSMWLAASITLVAAEAAAVPLFLSRGASQATIAQAGLIATGLHLLLSLSLSAVVFFQVKPGQPFLYWLLAMYWTSLILVATAAAREVKAAPVQKPGEKN